MNKYLKLSLKIFAWIVGSIIGLFLLIVVLIQVPAFQNIIKNKVVTFLEGKFKTPVKIDKIEIGLPKKLVLRGFYFESQTKDTLLAGDKLAVDISLFKILDNQIEINSLDLEGIVTNIKRNQDSVFNFDYMIKAFVSGQTKPAAPTDTSAAMKFSINKINLDKIRVRFNDAITKNNVDVYLNHFDTNIKKFDLDSMDFKIPKITLSGLNVKLKQGLVAQTAKITVAVADSAASSPDLKLDIGTVDLQKIVLAYNNAGSKLITNLNLGKLLVNFNQINLKKQLIDIKSVEFTDTKGNLILGKEEKAAVKNAISAGTSAQATNANWKVNLNNADFSNIAFAFDDMNAPRQKKGMDFMHLDLKNINLSADNFYYSLDTISGGINKFTMQDKSGLNVQELKTNFYYGPKNAFLKNLYLKTPQTLLKDEIIVKYPSVAALSKTPGDLYIDANINGSKLGFKDILLLVPTLSTTAPFNTMPNAVMRINSKVIGKVKDLHIPKLEISGIGNTRIAASGNIKGLPDVNKAYFDLQIKDFRSTAKDINAFVPKGTIPTNIQLPSSFGAKGFFKGGIDNFNTNLALASSYGSAKIKASFDQRVKNSEKYQAVADINNFDVGKLIKNDSIGKISLRANIKGIGLDPKTANATLNGTLIKAEYNKYTYKNLALKGNIANGLFKAAADMKDPNLYFDLAANGSFTGKYPAVKMKLNLDSVDLKALNLYSTPLKVRGVVDADIKTADPNYLNGSIYLTKLLIADDKQRYQLDSVKVISSATANKNSLKLTSQILSASLEGKYQLTEVGTALSNTISKYYDTGTSTTKPDTLKAQQFAFTLNVSDDPILYSLVPSLTRIQPIAIKGRYNSRGDTLTVNGTMPKIIYAGNTVTNGRLNIKTDSSALKYSLLFDQIKSASLQLNKTSLTGQLKNNLLDYRLQVLDKADKEQYLIAGNLKALPNSDSEFRLNLDGLKLNYQPWKVSNDNVIKFGANGINANNFVLSNAGQSIKIQSQQTSANSPLAIDLSNFKIETITNIISKDSLLAGGVINGNIVAKNLAATPTFNADLNIKDFNFMTDTVGNVAVKVNNNTPDVFNADVAITGNGNQVNLTGLYNTSSSSFDMNLDMQRLNLKSIQGFTLGNITDAKGFLNGAFTIKGTTTAPQVLGDVAFNNAAFRVTPLNSYFKVGTDKIVFNGDGILFNQFSLADSADNKLSLNGAIYTKTFTDFRFNLEVKAKNFMAVNSTEKDNDLYYGKLFFDTKLRIKGDLNNPLIDGNLKINKDTKLTLVLPQSDPGIADREGIVEFIDQDDPAFNKAFVLPDSLNKTKVTGINLSMNIEVDPEAELTVVIDKGNGDFVKLRGQANLSAGIDPSGKISLTGKYELQEGFYEMSFNFIKRQFQIQKGSTVLWTGDPLSANLDVTAIYVAETAPIDLVSDQLGSENQAQRNTYKQKLPFNVLLMMKGELLKPEISFDVTLPDGNYNVPTDVLSTSRTKLAQLREQPSELNKQVFALLLLNRFIGENPFASEAGSGGAQTLVRQSVSKIISQQLNDLAGDLIGGVNLNFDLQSTNDYSTGNRQNRTDLNVGLSKSLLNDRLKVTIGSSFGLEGPQQSNQKSNNIAGDVSVDYSLSKDGRYLLRAYRKNQYQVALQGQVIETGLGFIITMDYNKFKQLFEKSKQQKKDKEQ
ncbi:translocation/assembly module TamB domain-containing protein [Pedobacter sp. SD-b]|uniref:Translocation/assembly module TamB domain-containing protein n=1 Tax=Pedobacter segetis TaxID=2793069 RepID=A0ABS1BID4_9SPHI|nr:translocation/assembly module TamB domain-containing protein [Pedobacter segetis]MBK0382648.1 translocation/assembly module TamB domain-containing protein [Pedobacter segetis]